MARIEIRVAGYGGQGVILSAYILGRAAALHGGKHATMNQAFGPEARGSSCSAQLVVDEGPIHYPYVTAPTVLIAMSQTAYDRYVTEVAPGATVLVESELVDPGQGLDGGKVLSVPATRIAESLGNRIYVNMVMVGFFTAATGIFPRRQELWRRRP